MNNPTTPTPAEIAEIIAEEYGNLPEPEATCPSIDPAIKSIVHVRRDLQGALRSKKMEADELRDVIESADRDLDDINLEPLRKQNIALRDWGLDWKNTAVKIKKELDAALLACAERGVAPPSGEVEGIIKALGDPESFDVPTVRRNLIDRTCSLLLRLSAPPVAAGEATCKHLLQVQPSGEAAPKPHTAKFTGEYYRALADGTKGVDSETFEDALNHAAYLADSVRALSDGKAAAEARAERLRDHYECKMSGAERGTRLEAWATDAERGRAASESRCAALERALREILEGDGTKLRPSLLDAARAALSSAEPAKPEMPECVKELIWHHRALIADLRQAFPEGKHIGHCDSWGACIACTDLHDKEVDEYTNAVESYYAKPSATAGEEKS